MKCKRLGAIILAATLTMGTFVGCQSKAADSAVKANTEGKVKDKIVYSINTPPTGVFNPLLSDTRYDGNVNGIIYTSLLDVDNDGNLVPSLAESYKVSDDQKTITFKINKNAKWHDDKPVTTEDVVFTIESLANPKYTGSYAGNISDIKGVDAYNKGKAKTIEGIKVVDENTIEIQLEKAYAPAIVNIAGVNIIPKHVWSKVPVENWEKATDLLRKPIGSGAYKLSKFEPGQYVEFEAYDKYFGEKAKTKKFILKVTNPDTLQAELKNGNVDIANIKDMKNNEVENVKKQGFDVATYPDFMFQYMGFNLRKSTFKDKKVRQAFMYALDRKSMVDKLLEGRGEEINTALLPSGWAYPESGLNEYKFDVEKAKGLLKEAGWEDKNKDGVLENAKGEKFQAELKYPTGLKAREQTALIIKESLKKVGVDVKLTSMEFPTLMEQVVANHEFDLYLMGNTLSSDPDPKPFWYSEAASDKKGEEGWNIVGYRNKEVDKLLDEGISTIDRNKRKKTYEQFGKIINEDVPEAFLYVQNNDVAYNKKLKNFKPSTFSEFRDIEKWYIGE